MAASSVTGVSGPGMSHGRYNPAMHVGCGCGGKVVEQPVLPPRRSVCSVNYAVGQRSSHSICNRAVKRVVCN